MTPRLRSDHIAFPSYDPGATHRFHTRVMRFPLVFALSGPSESWGGDYLLTAYAIGDGRALDFFHFDGIRRPAPDGLPRDIRHVAFVAGSRRAVADWKRRLDRHGVAWTSEEHGPGDEHLYFADPNDVLFEIGARADGPRAARASRTALRTLRRWLAGSRPA
jgi:catechol 2,3-dioxygenase-like lactoylglutathione lyase family enzyme